MKLLLCSGEKCHYLTGDLWSLMEVFCTFQLEKNAKSNLMLKDLYVENAQLMKALQVLEQRQKSTEKKNFVLEEKISSLNKIIGEITLASQ